MPRILRGSIVSCGSLRADRGDGDRLPGGDVRGGGRDRQRLLAADVDLTDLQAVGVRMFLERDDLADDDAGDDAGARTISSTGKPSVARRSAIASRSSGRSTYSRSQRNRNAHESTAKLLQKIGIAFDEAADVVDLVARQRRCVRCRSRRPSRCRRRDRTRLRAARSDAPCRSRRARSSPTRRTCCTRSSSPLHFGHVVSTSALGSVNGKNDGRKRTFCSAPKSSRHMPVSMPLRWPK